MRYKNNKPLSDRKIDFATKALYFLDKAVARIAKEARKKGQTHGSKCFEEHYANMIVNDEKALTAFVNKVMPNQNHNVNINIEDINLRDKETEVAKQLTKMQQSKRISTTYEVIKDQKDTPKDQPQGNTIPKQANE